MYLSPTFTVRGAEGGTFPETFHGKLNWRILEIFQVLELIGNVGYFIQTVSNAKKIYKKVLIKMSVGTCGKTLMRCHAQIYE